MMGPIVEKSVWFFITLFSVFFFFFISQFSNFWVINYGNWKYIKCVFSFHNSVFNGIFVNNIIYRVPLSDSTATFDPLFFSFLFFSFFFLSSLGSMHAVSSSSFFLFPFTLDGFFFFFFFHCMWYRGFFFFHWVQWVWILGVKRKKKKVKVAPSDRYVAHKQLKNIEWWQVSDGAKRGGVFYVMSDK